MHFSKDISRMKFHSFSTHQPFLSISNCSLRRSYSLHTYYATLLYQTKKNVWYLYNIFFSTPFICHLGIIFFLLCMEVGAWNMEWQFQMENSFNEIIMKQNFANIYTKYLCIATFGRNDVVNGAQRQSRWKIEKKNPFCSWKEKKLVELTVLLLLTISLISESIHGIMTTCIDFLIEAPFIINVVLDKWRRMKGSKPSLSTKSVLDVNGNGKIMTHWLNTEGDLLRSNNEKM